MNVTFRILLTVGCHPHLPISSWAGLLTLPLNHISADKGAELQRQVLRAQIGAERFIRHRESHYPLCVRLSETVYPEMSVSLSSLDNAAGVEKTYNVLNPLV